MQVPHDQFSISDKVYHHSDLTLEENLRLCREVGFTHIHLSRDWGRETPLTDEEVAETRRALDATGMRVLDVHGCHKDHFNNLWDPDPEVRERGEHFFRHRLRVTADLGGDAMVYHVPVRVEPTPEVLDRFLRHFAPLVGEARDLGVVVALENHYAAENDRWAFAACFERFPEDAVRFTFDPGHGLISGNTDWLLRHAMPRLHVLHLNDNDTRKDLHLLPYDPNGHADWTAIARAIAASPYAKPLQLEVRWGPGEGTDLPEFLGQAATAVKRLAAEVNRVAAGAID